MTDGFLRVCAVSPAIRVADVAYNEGKIIEAIRAAADEDAKLIVFPEDVVCGYTCGDLFLHDRLLIEVKRSLVRIAESTAGIDALIFVGAPIEYLSSVYNTACVINRGHILGFVPKTMIPNYDEFYEGRQFSAANEKPVPVILDEDHVAPMHADMIFSCADMPGLKVADLGIDAELLKAAQTEAETLLREDPDLSAHPATAERRSEKATRSAAPESFR